MSESKSSDMSWGFILIVLGVLFLLHQLDIVSFGEIVRTFWPVILIVMGLKLVLSRDRAEASPESVSGDGPIRRSQFFGDLSLKIDAKKFQGGRISTIIGYLELDLSDMELEPGEKVLNVSGMIGDINITLPKKAECSVKGTTTIGDIRILDLKDSGFSVSKTYQSTGYEGAPKRLFISVSQVIGDIKVDQATTKTVKK